MLKGYENSGIRVDVTGMPRIINSLSGWELAVAKTYPPTEQMNDFLFFNQRDRTDAMRAVIHRVTTDAQRAEQLGHSYATNADREAFRAKHGVTFKVTQFGDKDAFVEQPWPEAQFRSFVELVFVAHDRFGWFEGGHKKPDILEFRPVNWDESLFQTIVHS